MERVPFTAEYRTLVGSGNARRLRRAGRVPGVLYGRGADPKSLTVDAKELSTLLRAAAGGAVLVDLTLSENGETAPVLCIVKEVQTDPLTWAPLNVDFLRISMSETLSVEVPITGEGEPAGVDLGGVLQQQLRSIMVSCLPSAIPSEIVVDITALEIGQSLHVGELTVPEGVVVETDSGETVFLVSAPSVVEEEPEEPVEGEEDAGEDAEGETAEGEGDE